MGFFWRNSLCLHFDHMYRIESGGNQLKKVNYSIARLQTIRKRQGTHMLILPTANYKPANEHRADGTVRKQRPERCVFKMTIQTCDFTNSSCHVSLKIARS